MNILITLGSVTCLFAVAMAIMSAARLHRAEIKGYCARPYVLPVFVGAAYVVLNSLSLYDLINAGRLRPAVQVVEQLIQTMLIVSVMVLLHRRRR